MKRPVQNARGAILIMAAIMMAVLIGVAALALDLGRLFVLHTEMQNAVDAAAISAAAELDGEDNAQERAMAAANQEMLNHLSHFGNKAELLENLQNKEGLFTFYSWIGSNADSPVPPSTCTPVDGKCEIDDPSDNSVSYVKITLDPDPALFGTDDGRYEIDLYFLPVLSLFSIETATTASTKVEALAGSHYEVCNYPPMMICDPSEGGPALNPGEMVKLKAQTSPNAPWIRGNFGWLTPKYVDEDPIDSSLNGNRLMGHRLGSRFGMPCDPPIVTTNPGQKQGWTRWGLNTRFGIYAHNQFRNNKKEYPSAPNVIDYPRDDTIHPVPTPPGNRFGTGVWNDTETGYEDRPSVFGKDDNNPPGIPNYNSHFHPTHDAAGTIPDMTTRLQYYNWEMSDPANIPAIISIFDPHDDEEQCVQSGQQNQQCRMLNGTPFSGGIDEIDITNQYNRRELFVAAVACNTIGVRGKMTIDMDEVDGKWMRFLMSEHVTPPNTPNEGITIHAEFIEEVTDKEDEHFKTVIQLYE